jgi:hypothetical protein
VSSSDPRCFKASSIAPLIAASFRLEENAAKENMQNNFQILNILLNNSNNG